MNASSANTPASTALVDALDALLPQTQCTRCGFPTCRDYAQAIARGEADIDRCPPGGTAGVDALAERLGRQGKPLNAEYGSELPPQVALIDESACIGCTKCIQACPVDAIVGTAKRMHSVIADECTGCELCVAPCPVDCIAIVPIASQPLARAQVLARARLARARFDARTARLAQADAAIERSTRGASAPPSDAAITPAATPPAPPPPITRSAVLEAIARGKARRATRESP